MRTRMKELAAVPPLPSLPLAPLDVPLTLKVGRALDLEALADACRKWRGVGTGHADGLEIEVDVAPDLAGHGDVRFAVSGSTMTLRGPGVRACADTRRQSASCFVSADYLDDPHRLAEEVLEPLTLRLVTRADRTPIHAAGIVIDGLAIVLAGRSGSGKSCLAQSADAIGLQLLSDDVVYVQTAPALRVWGWPTATHLLPNDAPSPDLPVRVRNGKTKHVLPLRSASLGAVSCEQAVLCVLSWGDKPALAPLSAAEARRRLWPLDPGFDELPRQINAAIGALAARRAWELSLSNDPAAAIRLLVSSLDRLRDSDSG
jgi:hypothetical protein